MKYFVKINFFKTVDEFEGTWTNADYIELLKKFGFAAAEKEPVNALKEMLFMAITDFEPKEAAAIMLDYKLSDVLTPGQIYNLSLEMTREKVSEKYADIYIHKTLFNINELLYKAYNGKFPAAKATVVEFEMKPEHTEETEITGELVLKAFSAGLSDSNLINRLFKEQLEGLSAFPEAEGIVWDMLDKGNNQYIMTTSERWIGDEDFESREFEGLATPFIQNTEEE